MTHVEGEGDNIEKNVHYNYLLECAIKMHNINNSHFEMTNDPFIFSLTQTHTTFSNLLSIKALHVFAES
jgi:hypothetical protein